MVVERQRVSCHGSRRPGRGDGRERLLSCVVETLTSTLVVVERECHVRG